MFEQQNQVKISILVPIYNSESFLVVPYDGFSIRFDTFATNEDYI